MENKINTGYLNNTIDLNKCKGFFEYHSGIEIMFDKFKPIPFDKQGFKLYFNKFLAFKRKNESELANYKFYPETIESHISGSKTSYHTNYDFNSWSELFEYYFLVLKK